MTFILSEGSVSERNPMEELTQEERDLIAREEYLNDFGYAGSILLDGQMYAIIISPDDDPSDPQFHLHPSDNPRGYWDYDQNDEDICIRFDRPEYVYDDRYKLSEEARKSLMHYLNEAEIVAKKEFSNWDFMRGLWYSGTCHYTPVPKSILDYTKLS